MDIQRFTNLSTVELAYELEAAPDDDDSYELVSKVLLKRKRRSAGLPDNSNL